MSETAPETGYRSIDDAVAQVLELEAVPLEARPAVFEAAHVALRDALANAATLVHEPTTEA